MSRENDRNGNIIIGLAIAAIVWFVCLAIKRGRTKELIATTLILFGVWYAMSSVGIDGKFYWLPFINYVAVWVYLLVFDKKKPVYLTCKHWGDEKWWWSLDGWQFEEEVAKVFEKNGYKAEVTKKTGDGGVDIVLYKDKKKYIVQCKHYINPVGPEPVRALWGVREDFQADGVIMIASSGISESSQEFIENKPDFEVMDLRDIMYLGSD